MGEGATPRRKGNGTDAMNIFIASAISKSFGANPYLTNTIMRQSPILEGRRDSRAVPSRASPDRRRMCTKPGGRRVAFRVAPNRRIAPVGIPPA